MMSSREDDLVKSILAPYANDLWIERCGKLKEVLDSLKDALANQSSSGRDWIQFIKFLETDCSGRHFSLDKQWGELLNLMMISRRLNHKSVKFKDIIANKQQIESNAQRIQRFNAAAQLGQAIEAGLLELEQSIQSCRLILSASDSRELELDKLMNTKNHLHNKCSSAIQNLKLTIEDERLQKDPRLDTWRARVAKFGLTVGKISEFVAGMIELQSKLSKIRYLDSVETADVSIHKSAVRESIELCRQKMREIQEFNRRTIELLHQVATRTLRATNLKPSGLQLVKLFEPKSYISGQEIQMIIQKLDDCQKNIDAIMQDLRIEFGRFYFLNDQELLTVVMIDTLLLLDSPENTRLICKLFNNSIDSFILDEHQQFITAVRSPTKEIIQFSRDQFIPLRKQIQIYSLELVRILNEVQRKLRKTLKMILMESLRSESSNNKIDWSLPVQLVNLAECVKFCSRVEKAFETNSGTLDALIEFYRQQTEQLSDEIASSDVGSNKISVVTSLNVHFISLLLSLRREGVSQREDWHWQKQVRYYLIGDEEIEIRIADAKFPYKFDYLCIEHQSSINNQAGAVKRLISTKVTQRCFLLASQAVCHMRLGANPFGPAGGGKTESIKALGHLLGQQVIVHNCDESNDADSLDRLIWGLAHTGHWGCFDEFNRLSSSTMSLISATLELVQSSISENRTTVEQNNNGSLVCIDRDSAFFITLNPASGNNRYKGRRRLPANLRNLFLPISMARVQIDSIVRENLLVLSMERARHSKSNDDENLLELGLNMQNFFQQMKLINFGSDRCEWDLRLVMASLQRLRLVVTINCLDGNRLDQLMVDAFSCEVEPRLSKSEFVDFKKLLHESKLTSFSKEETSYESQMDKRVDQLRRQLETRAGVLLLGSTKSGKSTVWRRLFDDGEQSTKWIALNPKFCSNEQLFGCFLGESNGKKKWQDGFFTAKVREALNLLQEQTDLRRVCIILDGPIDPDWVESLNSVLDDNRVLTLGSGERLNFSLSSGQTIKLLFESDNIDAASPATISRLGMVYFEPGEMEPLNEVPLSQLSEVDKYLQDPEWQLLIICCQTNLESQAIDNYFRESSNMDISGYSCSSSSSSSHLANLLSWAPRDRLFIIHNVHLIAAQDQWGSRSFLELLRFVMNYGGYYDERFFLRPVKQVKFVLTCESLDQIGLRLARKSNLVVHLHTREDLQSDLLESFVGVLKQDQALIVLKNVQHFSIGEVNQLVSCACPIRGGQKENIRLFRSSSEARESLSYLEKQLSNNYDSLLNALFILHDIELNLMDRKTEARLLHQLNRLDPSKQINFVFVCHSEKIPRNFKALTSFRYSLQRDHDEVLQEFRTLMRQTFEHDQRLAWLDERISSEFSANTDKERIDSLLKAFVRLYEKSNANLLLRQKALKNGLAHLRDFDEKVERMREQCKQQEEALRDKNKEIICASESIDSILRDSEQQRRRTDELRHELNAKRSETLKKGEQLESELAKVGPMLEASKAEIQQHLKPEALNEIKTLRAPPKTIKDILDALFILLGVRDLSWASMKSYLASKSLRDELTNYQFEKRINKEMLTSVRNLVRQRQESFSEDQAKRASKAIVPLLGWIQAALEYGRVLIKSSPLREQLKLSNAELEQLNNFLQKSETDLMEINRVIQEQEKNLLALREEKQNLEVESSKIQQQLQKSLQLRVNLENQSIRWGQDLHRINYFVSDSSSTESVRLIKMCYMVMNLAFNCPKGSDGQNLQTWLRAFDLEESREHPKNWVDFICNGPLGLVLADFEPDLKTLPQEMRIVKLIALRQFIELAERPWLPFIPIEGEEFCQDEVLESLCHGNILGLSPGSISYVRFQNDLNRLKQTVQVASNLGSSRLICIDVRQIDDISHLDLASFLLNRSANSCKYLLVGSTSGCFERNLARYLIEFPIIQADQNKAIEQIQAKILDAMLRSWEPSLMKNLESKQIEVRERQKNMRANELILLNQLVAKTDSCNSDRNNINFGGVVKVLDELQQQNQELSKDLRMLEELKRSLDSRQSQYQADALDAAKFYCVNETPSGPSFSRLSMKKYIQLLLGKSDDAIKSSSAKTNNKKLIARYAMLSMDPERRLEYIEKLCNSANYDAACYLGANELDVEANTFKVVNENGTRLGCLLPRAESQLARIIARDVLAHTGNAKELSNARCKLIVVLHDPSKSSSPQQQLDRLFAGSTAARALFEYDKVYATGSDKARLELALGKFTAVSSLRATKALCLCVVNAHLSSDWLNANLLDYLENSTALTNNLDGSLSASGHMESCQLRVLILIAEAGAAELSLFDERILDYAQLRYWHDELALSLVDRFDDCVLSSEAAESELARQLILLHVVCQELSRTKRGGKPLGWLSSVYSFDSEQLALALKTLERLAASSEGPSTEKLRARLSDYMADIVYGSRMESVEDELRLEKLIGRFLRSGESAREQLEVLAELRQAKGEQKLENQLVAKLIGLPAEHSTIY